LSFSNTQRPACCFVLTLLGSISLAGCAALPTAKMTLPDQHTLVREPLVFHSDFRLPAHHRLLDELIRLQADITTELGLPASDEPVHLYLFRTPERYNTFMRGHYPDFPSRRALFLETDTRLVVFAHWGDRVAEDLRHEVAHGYLHASVQNLPLWIDEGLAEYFEVARGHGGLNRPHVELLTEALDAGTWQPDLARLEALDSFATMTQRDYAESWAWMYWLLATTPERRDWLREYLQTLRLEGHVQPLSTGLASVDDDANRELIGMLKSLRDETQRVARHESSALPE